MGAWKPGKVVLYGWCADFNLRAEQGISESVARRVLAVLEENDGKWSEGHIDWNATKFLPSFPTLTRIDIFLKNPAYRTAQIIKSRLERFLQVSQIKINKLTPAVKGEARPDLVPLNQAAGRAMSFFRSQRVPVERGPGQVVRPLWVTGRLDLKHLPSDTIVASFTPGEGWNMKEALLQCMPGIDRESAVAFFKS